LPVGCYWNRRDRYWYTIRPTEDPKRKRLAGHGALLSDLHAAMEALGGVDRTSLDYMLAQFEASRKFRKLADGTQDNYRYCRRVLQGFQTKLGIPFAELRRASITAPVIQRLVDAIAETHPTKANAVKRDLSAAYKWGGLRMGVKDNPARGVEQAAEKGDPRMPSKDTMRAMIAFLRARGSLPSRSKGSLAPYVWAVAEIAYRCRMRSVEVRDLTDANATDEGIIVIRRKGSLDNITAWCPELREAWDWLAARRDRVWAKRRKVIPMLPKDRPLVVNESGGPLSRYTLNSAWRRAMAQALEAGIITPEERFGLHGLKHRGITDSPGKRRDKQDAGGHKKATTTDIYNHELDVYEPAGKAS
jgi:site-specific recombinase XerD